jgi:vacuolar protein sorting-associated protein 13A/C
MAKVFGYSDKIISLFKDYYKFNLMTQAVKLLFSIDILGNPIGLLENIAGGVKDFFYLPIQGFVKGPIYFIQGGAKGTKSLISHTIGGAFDSTQKITSSVGKHVLKITDVKI